MARQQVAIEWKIKTITTDDKRTTFIEKTSRLGRYTAATAAEKMTRRFPGYRFVHKPNHGFGGYWVDSTGNTAELLPA